MKLNDTATKIHKLKYSKEGKETWEETCYRVANYIANAEGEKKEEYFQKFFNVIYNQNFIPGGRILANSNSGISNLMNCIVLGVEDSRDGIYNTLKEAAELFAHGYGIGYNFSKVREKNAPIKTTSGKASGPLSFMSLFDQTGEVISQASRRGAQIAFLNIDHPDIENFITFKSKLIDRNARILEDYIRNLHVNGMNIEGRKYFKVLEKTLQDDQLTHFNISVLVNSDFMEACKEDLDWYLISRSDGSIVKTIKAKELLMKMAKMAWESGDPGIAFFDRINEDNMVHYIGELNSSNPCSELFLFPGEGCCLGSINLHSFYIEETNSIDLEYLEYVVRLAVRFLDDVQSVSESPIKYINVQSKGLRRLGLGVMGWADLLAELEIPYDSDDALDLAEYLSWFISFFSWLESIELAKEKGSFYLYNKKKVNLDVVEKSLHSRFQKNKFNMEEIRENGLRNVAITSLAPTGTIALLAGVNSSIEPFFALAYKRNITEGIGNVAKDSIIEINPILEKKLIKYGFSESDREEIKNYIQIHGTLKGIPKNLESIGSAFLTSFDISWERHIFMQAAWQKFIDNSISKTINMKENSTPEDIYNAYMLMYESGLKSSTIYRNNSKSFQILNVGIKD